MIDWIFFFSWSSFVLLRPQLRMLHLREFLLRPRSTQAAVRQVRATIAIATVTCMFIFISANNRAQFSLQNSPVFHYHHNSSLTLVKASVCEGQLEFHRMLVVLRVPTPYSDTRNYVREKIKNSGDCAVKAIFLYGKFLGDRSKQFQALIDAEQEAFGDIVQVKDVADYRCHGQRAVDAMKVWLNKTSCVVYQQVAFGTFQLPAATKYHGKKIFQ